MRNALRLALVATLLLGCVGCDQISKEVARAHLPLGESHSLLGDTLRIMHVENAGAFLSIGAGLSEHARVVIFQGAISALVLGLLWAAAFRAATGQCQVVGFTLLAASGIGNLIDRFSNDGLVTDFLNLGIGSIRTGIFNVADVVGLVGCVLLLLAGRAATRSND
jgi:signal peptidase II